MGKRGKVLKRYREKPQCSLMSIMGNKEFHKRKEAELDREKEKREDLVPKNSPKGFHDHAGI